MPHTSRRHRRFSYLLLLFCLWNAPLGINHPIAKLNYVYAQTLSTPTIGEANLEDINNGSASLEQWQQLQVAAAEELLAQESTNTFFETNFNIDGAYGELKTGATVTDWEALAKGMGTTGLALAGAYAVWRQRRQEYLAKLRSGDAAAIEDLFEEHFGDLGTSSDPDSSAKTLESELNGNHSSIPSTTQQWTDWGNQRGVPAAGATLAALYALWIKRKEFQSPTQKLAQPNFNVYGQRLHTLWAQQNEDDDFTNQAETLVEDDLTAQFKVKLAEDFTAPIAPQVSGNVQSYLDAEATLANIAATQPNLNTRKTQLVSQVRNSNYYLTSAERGYNNYVTLLENTEKQVQDITQQKQDAQNSLDNLDTEFDTRTEVLADLNTTRGEWATAHSQANSQFNQHLNLVNSRLNSSTAEANNPTYYVTRYQGYITSADSRIASYQRTIDTYENYKTLYPQNAAAYQRTIDAYKGYIKTQQDNKTQYEKNVAYLQNTSVAQLQQNALLAKEVAAANRQFYTYKNQVDSYQSSIRSFKNTIASYERTIQSWIQRYGENYAGIQTYRTYQQNMRDRIVQYQDMLSTAQTSKDEAFNNYLQKLKTLPTDLHGSPQDQNQALHTAWQNASDEFHLKEGQRLENTSWISNVNNLRLSYTQNLEEVTAALNLKNSYFTSYQNNFKSIESNYLTRKNNHQNLLQEQTEVENTLAQQVVDQQAAEIAITNNQQEHTEYQTLLATYNSQKAEYDTSKNTLWQSFVTKINDAKTKAAEFLALKQSEQRDNLFSQIYDASKHQKYKNFYRDFKLQNDQKQKEAEAKAHAEYKTQNLIPNVPVKTNSVLALEKLTPSYHTVVNEANAKISVAHSKYRYYHSSYYNQQVSTARFETLPKLWESYFTYLKKGDPNSANQIKNIINHNVSSINRYGTWSQKSALNNVQQSAQNKVDDLWNETQTYRKDLAEYQAQKTQQDLALKKISNDIAASYRTWNSYISKWWVQANQQATNTTSWLKNLTTLSSNTAKAIADQKEQKEKAFKNSLTLLSSSFSNQDLLKILNHDVENLETPDQVGLNPLAAEEKLTKKLENIERQRSNINNLKSFTKKAYAAQGVFYQPATNKYYRWGTDRYGRNVTYTVDTRYLNNAKISADYNKQYDGLVFKAKQEAETQKQAYFSNLVTQYSGAEILSKFTPSNQTLDETSNQRVEQIKILTTEYEEKLNVIKNTAAYKATNSYASPPYSTPHWALAAAKTGDWNAFWKGWRENFSDNYGNQLAVNRNSTTLAIYNYFKAEATKRTLEAPIRDLKQRLENLQTQEATYQQEKSFKEDFAVPAKKLQQFLATLQRLPNHPYAQDVKTTLSQINQWQTELNPIQHSIKFNALKYAQKYEAKQNALALESQISKALDKLAQYQEYFVADPSAQKISSVGADVSLLYYRDQYCCDNVYTFVDTQAKAKEFYIKYGNTQEALIPNYLNTVSSLIESMVAKNGGAEPSDSTVIYAAYNGQHFARFRDLKADLALLQKGEIPDKNWSNWASARSWGTKYYNARKIPVSHDAKLDELNYNYLYRSGDFGTNDLLAQQHKTKLDSYQAELFAAREAEWKAQYEVKLEDQFTAEQIAKYQEIKKSYQNAEQKFAALSAAEAAVAKVQTEYIKRQNVARSTNSSTKTVIQYKGVESSDLLVLDPNTVTPISFEVASSNQILGSKSHLINDQFKDVFKAALDRYKADYQSFYKEVDRVILQKKANRERDLIAAQKLPQKPVITADVDLYQRTQEAVDKYQPLTESLEKDKRLQEQRVNTLDSQIEQLKDTSYQYYLDYGYTNPRYLNKEAEIKEKQAQLKAMQSALDKMRINWQLAKNELDKNLPFLQQRRTAYENYNSALTNWERANNTDAIKQQVANEFSQWSQQTALYWQIAHQNIKVATINREDPESFVALSSVATEEVIDRNENVELAEQSPFGFSSENPKAAELLEEFYKNKNKELEAINANPSFTLTSSAVASEKFLFEQAEQKALRDVGQTWDKWSNQHIQKLHPAIRTKTTELINRVQDELGIKLRINQDGHTRDDATQLSLYCNSRDGGICEGVQKHDDTGNWKSNAKPGESYHNYGLAVDLSVIEDDGSYNPGASYTEIAQIAQEVGLEHPLPVDDPNHFQIKNPPSISLLQQQLASGNTTDGYVNLNNQEQTSIEEIKVIIIENIKAGRDPYSVQIASTNYAGIGLGQQLLKYGKDNPSWVAAAYEVFTPINNTYGVLPQLDLNNDSNWLKAVTERIKGGTMNAFNFNKFSPESKRVLLEHAKKNHSHWKFFNKENQNLKTFIEQMKVFVDQDSFRSQMSKLSKAVYDPTIEVVGDYVRQDPADYDLNPQMMYNLDSGLKAAIYSNGENIVLAFAGSESGNSTEFTTDWILNNFTQGLGLPAKQYKEAAEIADSLNKATNGEITFTGHSLGGGLAATAGAVTGSQSVTFNAAGVHKQTLVNEQALRSNYDNIINYITPHDVLTNFQEASIIVPDALGNNFYRDNKITEFNFRDIFIHKEAHSNI